MAGGGNEGIIKVARGLNGLPRVANPWLEAYNARIRAGGVNESSVATEAPVVRVVRCEQVGERLAESGRESIGWDGRTESVVGIRDENMKLAAAMVDVLLWRMKAMKTPSGEQVDTLRFFSRRRGDLAFGRSENGSVWLLCGRVDGGGEINYRWESGEDGGVLSGQGVLDVDDLREAYVEGFDGVFKYGRVGDASKTFWRAEDVAEVFEEVEGVIGGDGENSKLREVASPPVLSDVDLLKKIYESLSGGERVQSQEGDGIDCGSMRIYSLGEGLEAMIDGHPYYVLWEDGRVRVDDEWMDNQFGYLEEGGDVKEMVMARVRELAGREGLRYKLWGAEFPWEPIK